MKRETWPLTRRGFLRGSALISAGLAGRTAKSFPNRLLLTPVAVSANLGLLFPSLLLLRKMDASLPGGNELQALSQLCETPCGGSALAQRIDVAFVFPATPGAEKTGNLGEKERQFLLDQIPLFLERDFAYRVVDLKTESSQSFWYPFLPNRIVCCGLTVRGGVPCAS